MVRSFEGGRVLFPTAEEVPWRNASASAGRPSPTPGIVDTDGGDDDDTDAGYYYDCDSGSEASDSTGPSEAAARRFRDVRPGRHARPHQRGGDEVSALSSVSGLSPGGGSAYSTGWMTSPAFGGAARSGRDDVSIPAAIVPPPKALGSAWSRRGPEEAGETVMCGGSSNSDDGLSVDSMSVSSQVPEEAAAGTAAASPPGCASPGRLSPGRLTELLFGDGTPARRVDRDGNMAEAIHFRSREVLPYEVFYNRTTQLWVVTIHTNQKALDRCDPTKAAATMQAYSFRTEDEARQAVLVMTPPRMMQFDDHPTCFDCGGKFAVFRRACHCRNCGVCICKPHCLVKWPAASLPDTYNVKSQSFVNACRSCHLLSSKFQDALLAGDLEQTLQLYEKKNINLRSPFAHVKGEVKYPIHCAVIGNNIKIVKWLVETNLVPLSIGKRKKGQCRDSPRDGTVMTSKGRSVMDLAMEGRNIDIITLFVVKKNISLLKYRDHTNALVLLEAALRRVAEKNNLPQMESDGATEDPGGNAEATPLRVKPCRPKPDQQGVAADSSKVLDDCIICCSNPIDCVIIPCGHQVCCLQCSGLISDCPICNKKSTFLRTFRP